MTEEKIKEEFERFGDYPVDARIQRLVKDIASKSPYCITNTKQEAIGFIYGVMAAERLAKIETLEKAYSVFIDEGICAGLQAMQKYISELKAGK